MDSLNKAIAQKINYVIFDDGLQDKNINYDISIVCFNSKNWVGNGMLIPSGPLREKIDSLKKYDVVFLNGNNNSNQSGAYDEFGRSNSDKNWYKKTMYQADGTPRYFGGMIYRPTQAAVNITSR